MCDSTLSDRLIQVEPLVSANVSECSKDEHGTEGPLSPFEKDIQGGRLLSTYRLNRIFPIAANIAVTVFLVLLYSVYTIFPVDEKQALDEGERMAATIAAFIAAISFVSVAATFILRHQRSGHMTGIVYAGLVIMAISMITNGMLACTPTPVKIDPIIHTRVFLIRWCEWIPCSGLMTFLCDGVDVPRSKESLRKAVGFLLCQSASCVFGLVFPFCPGIISWSISMVCSFAMYIPIFFRLNSKRQKLLNTPQGSSFMETERYSRHRHAYELMFICTWLWTVLVVAFVINGYVHFVLPEGHYLRPRSLNMYVDAAFDAIAKSLYLRQILEMHHAVFESEGLAQRRLVELRQFMSVLWTTSSDLIILSIKHEVRCMTLFSPALVGFLSGEATMPQDLQTALVLETECEWEAEEEVALQGGSHGVSRRQIRKAYLIDASEFAFEAFYQAAYGETIDPESFSVSIASTLVCRAWDVLETGQNVVSPLAFFDFQRENGVKCNCEMKVLPHAGNGMIAVVRDVSERYLRFEAERKAEAEVLKRQRESQSLTRFVRHEVKNGLLVGIELIDGLQNVVDDIEKICSTPKVEPVRTGISLFPQVGTTHVKPASTDLAECHQGGTPYVEPASTGSASRPEEGAHQAGGEPPVVQKFAQCWKRIGELDNNLHEALDTVLAEAMARDVINEVYHPRYENIDVLSLLRTDGSNGDRFPVRASQPDLPFLRFDPQLLRYIYRNALSNACKYGKQGEPVDTCVTFHHDRKEFELQVINTPGPGHEHLMELGDVANHTVFKQGCRLHEDFQIKDRFISSGDGAWVAQKCARAMGGSCCIRFEDGRTVFQFTCPAEPLILADRINAADFEVPPDTFGVAIDDSKIQRKLISRILGHVGVAEDRMTVIGENASDAMQMERILREILVSNPHCKVLVLVDENLDYGELGGEVMILSGSRVMKDILASLDQEMEQRVFAIVRSANDSTEDVATYLERTHGFFPKAPMNRDRVQYTALHVDSFE